MVRVDQMGSHHTNAYTFEVTDLPGGGVRVVRQPKAIGRVLGTAFQAMGALFLVVTPFALSDAGPTGALASLLCAGIGLGLGPVIRRARQILEVDGVAHTVDSAWWIGDTRVGINAHHLEVGHGARLSVKRVRAYRSQAGPPIFMFAVGVQPRAGAAPVVVIHTDRPEQAEDLTARMERALGLVSEEIPVPVS